METHSMEALSLAGSSSGASSSQTVYNFGTTYEVESVGIHKVTIVWLHGLGDTGCSWKWVRDWTNCHNSKWVFPTAPIRPIKMFEGSYSTAWFDIEDLSDAHDSVEGLDSSLRYLETLLAREPAEVKLVIGGFGIGGATALYAATCFARGEIFTRLDGIISIAGWIPSSKFLISNDDGVKQGAADRIASMRILLCDDTELPSY